LNTGSDCNDVVGSISGNKVKWIYGCWSGETELA